ncbi:PTS transporter subunit EIIB [Psychromonas ossibalaenae]|uniref:PTS transporter subunit EIIB n=1 Tax=Psychromonas ossibalaenae TaxID=444922 RepID=UPI0003674E58|nr:PTS glucose/sucrose transporter subunit IIB [Psychromonas ossibalaenae]
MLKSLLQVLKSLTKVNENLAQEVDDILQAIGGLENISDAGACATRLRLTLLNAEIIDTAALKRNGAIEVVPVDKNHIQIIYGMKANSYYQLIDQRLN